MKQMKKTYQQPVTRELLIKAVPLLAGSYLQVGETVNGGGINPDTEVVTGLSRYNVWDEDGEDCY
ncbi:MAG: hypothetical protein J5971_00850 [Prevotella sp.]|nr:hypothetical protein [Prevotella sp.]